MALSIASSVFAEGAPIPTRYTCDSADISPSLTWTGVPDEARSIALICDDPDAPRGTWVHWVLFNLPPDTTSLPENVPPGERLESGAIQGINDFGRIGYGGPCPPRGHGRHRYYLKLYALDADVDLPPGCTKSDLEAAMTGHILAEARLMGTYERR